MSFLHGLVISILIVVGLFAIIYISQFTPMWVASINALICLIVMGRYERDSCDHDLAFSAWAVLSFLLLYVKL